MLNPIVFDRAVSALAANLAMFQYDNFARDADENGGFFPDTEAHGLILICVDPNSDALPDPPPLQHG
jgi:hypothetical protein